MSRTEQLSPNPMKAGAIEDEQNAAPQARERGAHDLWMYSLALGLIGLAWVISQAGLFKSGDDVSYWLAVVGGVMMAVLLLYPARKHIRAMRNLGRVKWWFWMHMLFGLFGPWLILVHSTFRIGSLNAGVALFSMVIVVASGIVGRFIYVRVHRGLHGERTTLRELRSRAGFIENETRSKLAFAPEVEARLVAFEQRELAADKHLPTHLRQACWLPVQQWLTVRACRRALDTPLRKLANDQRWTDEELARRRRLADKLVQRYLEAVVRVAQFTAYERIFALWHVAHLPFVILLVASALVHVVAVHAY